MRTKFIATAGALALVGAGLGGLALAAPASAHTPAISATCSTGVVLNASNYDSGTRTTMNTWSITVNGVTTGERFGASTHQVVAFPQDGTVSTWSASIKTNDPNPAYSVSGSGTLTCGTKPPVIPEQPQPIVKVATTDGTPDCAVGTVTSTTTTTTTGYVYDKDTNTWVLGTPDVKTTTATREATQTECPPAPVIKPSIQSYLPNDVCPITADTRTAAFVLDNTASTADVTYTINGTPYVAKAGEAHHVDGLPVANAGTTFTITAGDRTWTFNAVPIDPTSCQPTTIISIPEAPTFVDKCGTADDKVILPNDTDEYTYQTEKLEDGTTAVTAVPRDGYVFNETTQEYWTYTFTDEKCATTPPVITPPVTTPTPTPTPTPTTTPVTTQSAAPVAIKVTPKATPAATASDSSLAYTGSDISPWLYLWVALFIAIGLALSILGPVLYRRRHRNQA